MLVGYAHAVSLLRGEVFKGGIASIWEIQDAVERAWDRGFNEKGRVQTGGIRGTRKHIGTPEVWPTFLKGVAVGCSFHVYEHRP